MFIYCIWEMIAFDLWALIKVRQIMYDILYMYKSIDEVGNRPCKITRNIYCQNKKKLFIFSNRQSCFLFPPWFLFKYFSNFLFETFGDDYAINNVIDINY
jgi:hypothetical protein